MLNLHNRGDLSRELFMKGGRKHLWWDPASAAAHSLLTSLFHCGKIYTKVNNSFSAPGAEWALGENRESGENPERYRHCKHGGLSQLRKRVIGFALRRPAGGLGCASQDTCWSGSCAWGLQVRAIRRLLTQKYGCGSLYCCRGFAFWCCIKWFPPYPASYRLPARKLLLRDFQGEVVRLPFFFMNAAAAVTTTSSGYFCRCLLWKRP